MINSIKINNFKILRNIDAKLSCVNLLTGVNGRGKSSFLQSLLVLSQSWKVGENRLLMPNGSWKNLGIYSDIHNVYHKEEPMTITIGTDGEKENIYELQYKQDEEKNTLGSLTYFSVDGIIMGDDNMGGYEKDKTVILNSDDKSLSSVSDYAALTQLKRVLYVSAERIAANYREEIDETSSYMRPDGSNLLNILYLQGEDTIKKVETRMSEVFEGGRLKIEKRNKEIVLTLNSINDDKSYSPSNVGYGFSYLLMVITASIIAKSDDILIIENLEAHLHPGAQAQIMQMLIRDAVSKRFQLFVETHSDHIVNTSLLEVKREESPCGLKDLQILFFSTREDENGHSEASVQNLQITPKGRILNPPRQFCDQYAMDLREIYG